MTSHECNIEKIADDSYNCLPETIKKKKVYFFYMHLYKLKVNYIIDF